MVTERPTLGIDHLTVVPGPADEEAATGTVEELELRGAPLGFVYDFPYQLVECTLEPGDTLLLMSDGLLELMNDRREMFGAERVRACLRRAATESPERVISRLLEAAAQWRGDLPLADDIPIPFGSVRTGRRTVDWRADRPALPRSAPFVTSAPRSLSRMWPSPSTGWRTRPGTCRGCWPVTGTTTPGSSRRPSSTRTSTASPA